MMLTFFQICVLKLYKLLSYIYTYIYVSFFQHKVRKVRTNLEDKYQHFLVNNKEKEEVPRKEGVPKTEENVVELESTDVEFQELRLLSSEKDDELIIPDAEMVSLSNTVSFDTQFETIPQSNNVSIDTQFETIGDSNKASVGMQTGIEAASESAFQKYKSNVKVRSVCTQTSKNMLREVENKEECKMTCSILTANLKSPVEHFEKSLEKDEQKCLFYTGLRFQQILILLSFLGPASNNLIYWNSTRKADVDEKYKAKRKFTPLQELLLVLTRLRCGFLLEDMSYRFEVSVGLLSSINITWIQFMYQEFSKQLRPRIFVLKEQVAKYLPAIFKSFKNLRVILDCTEFFCEAPANFEHQGNLYSHYKGHTTFKVLIGCTPNGGISFVSEVYEGSISDREIVIKSKLPEYLLPGDVVLADRGFTIHDLLEEVGAYLNIPPFLRNRNRFTAQEKIVTKKIANERIYVERVVGRLKQFRILQRTIPLNMRGIISQIVFVCACLVNFQDPIVFDEK